MIKLLLISLVRFYQYMISPMMRSHCRFFPSCSEYSIIAFKQYNVITGLFLTMRRLFSCHPFGEHGLDPVPSNYSLKRRMYISLKRFTK